MGTNNLAELGSKCTSPEANSIVGQLSSAPASSSAHSLTGPSGPLLGVSPARKSVCSHSYLRESTRPGNVLRFSGSSAPPDFSMLSTMHSGTGTRLRRYSCVFPLPHHSHSHGYVGTNKHPSSSATQSKALLQAPETPKALVQENHALLHLLDSKITWSESSDATMAPYGEIEPEHRPTPGGWFRNFGRWFGYSKQAAGVIPEV